jgi:hypothetical protein
VPAPEWAQGVTHEIFDRGEVSVNGQGTYSNPNTGSTTYYTPTGNSQGMGKGVIGDRGSGTSTAGTDRDTGMGK